MQKLVLSDLHESIGGKMVEFAGYYMPVQYEGVKAEHQAVRNAVGVFDVSHLGEIFVKGAEAEETNWPSCDPSFVHDRTGGGQSRFGRCRKAAKGVVCYTGWEPHSRCGAR